jgi:hypothetical protein
MFTRRRFLKLLTTIIPAASMLPAIMATSRAADIDPALFHADQWSSEALAKMGERNAKPLVFNQISPGIVHNLRAHQAELNRRNSKIMDLIKC